MKEKNCHRLEQRKNAGLVSPGSARQLKIGNTRREESRKSQKCVGNGELA